MLSARLLRDASLAQTDEAAIRGIFGASSFTSDDELFWGNDRLEVALAWGPQRALDFRYWHKADIDFGAQHVCFRE
jgi:hypothetical protein